MPARPDNWLPTRRSLLQRLKNWDDQESWKDFFDTYSRLIYSVALRSGFNPSEAEDIVQETVIAAAKHLPGFNYDPSIGSFKAWLLRIARRRIIDHVRQRQRQPAQNAPAPGDSSTALIDKIPDPHTSNLDRVWDEEWQNQLLAAALKKTKSQVSDTDFQIFDCYVLKKWSVKDVAATLDVSPAHVYVAKSRVSAALQQAVKTLEEKLR